MKDSATAEIRRLKPSQEYRLKCVMLPYDTPSKRKVSQSLPFQTEEAYFFIRNIHRWRRSVTYYVESNINAMIVCYIMTKRRTHRSLPNTQRKSWIRSKQRPPYTSESRWKSPTRTMHCSQSVKCMIQTTSVRHGFGSQCSSALYECGRRGSDGKQVENLGKLRIDRLFRMVCLFPVDPSRVGIGDRLLRVEWRTTRWKCLAPGGWVRRRIREEEMERLQLLKRAVPETETKPKSAYDELDDLKNQVPCSRCGYMNSKQSTVCKECNALLYGGTFFNSKNSSVYYCRVC